MSALDWGIVPLLNGSIIAYGLYWSCGVVAIGWAPSAVVAGGPFDVRYGD